MSAIPGKTRWLAVAAGCFSAIFGAPAFGAVFLILGAVIQPRARATGRWLMWVGAFFLSYTVVPSGPPLVFEGAKTLRSGGDKAWMYLLFAIATALVFWCDIALVREAFTLKPDEGAREPTGGRMDWVAWIVALVLTAWLIYGGLSLLRSHQLHDLLGEIFNLLAWSSVVLLFDIALIVHAVRSREKGTG